MIKAINHLLKHDNLQLSLGKTTTETEMSVSISFRGHVLLEEKYEGNINSFDDVDFEDMEDKITVRLSEKLILLGIKKLIEDSNKQLKLL